MSLPRVSFPLITISKKCRRYESAGREGIEKNSGGTCGERELIDEPLIDDGVKWMAGANQHRINVLILFEHFLVET